MLNITCVKWGSKYSAEYVNILYDMVRRNLPDGFPGRFVCFTDDPTGLEECIETRPLEPGLIGWWNKLSLFKNESFPLGDRVFFLDLDTVITGKLDDLMSYSGEFALQRDFFTYNLGSAVMAWEAGTMQYIWDAFEAAGRPDTPGGDQAFITQVCPNPKFLCDIFPGSLVSFKRHCLPYPPRSASVVCFHGEPKPHEVDVDWVKMTWKIGGGTSAMIECVCNTAENALKGNIASASKRNVEWVTTAPAHSKHAVIVGGAPSIVDCGDELAWRQDRGQHIFALNGAFGYLTDQGIDPEFQVIVDARESNADFVPETSTATHLIASQCHPALWDKAEKLKCLLWHSCTENIRDAIEGADELHLIGGGNTVGLSAMALAYTMGYREIHLYGMDSSLSDGEHHAYQQKGNDKDVVMEVLCNGRQFFASAWMISQAEQFQELSANLANLGCVITVHGDGLLPWVAQQMMQADFEEQEETVCRTHTAQTLQ
jgi:uncharacterized Rossmann fold enzyme